MRTYWFFHALPEIRLESFVAEDVNVLVVCFSDMEQSRDIDNEHSRELGRGLVEKQFLGDTTQGSHRIA
jgi:hypothetical protein